MPVRDGGIDWVAVTTARMRGWTTRTFLERHCFHHRAMGTADRSLWRARFRHGRKDYMVGGHPAWQILRGALPDEEPAADRWRRLCHRRLLERLGSSRAKSRTERSCEPSIAVNRWRDCAT